MVYLFGAFSTEHASRGYYIKQIRSKLNQVKGITNKSHHMLPTKTTTKQKRYYNASLLPNFFHCYIIWVQHHSKI